MQPISIDGHPGAHHPANPVAVRVASGVGHDAGPSGREFVEFVAGVGVQAEVVVAALRVGTVTDPLLMVPHHDDRSIHVGADGVEPVDLFGRDRPGGGSGDRRVEQRHGDAREVDALVTGIFGLVTVRVVIAPHDVQTVAEGPPVARLEGVPLDLLAVDGQVTLDDHGRRVDRRDLARRGSVHHLGIRLGAGFGPADRTVREIVDPARFDLAEMDVVDRRESAQKRARRSSERTYRDTVEIMIGIRSEALVAPHVEPVVHDDQVVRDGRDVHWHGRGRAGSGQTLTTIELTTLSCQVCFLSSQSIHR